MSTPADNEVEQRTRRWIEHVVVGLGLCPFAATPFRAGRVSIVVSAGESLDEIYQAFLATLYGLLTSLPEDNETSLLVLRDGLAEFEEYLDMLGVLEQSLVEAGAQGMVQIASFHPDYRFDDAEDDDPANFTNRSPYPMFHLIREDGLAEALANYPDPAAIPERNIARLRSLGLSGIRALLDDKC